MRRIFLGFLRLSKKKIDIVLFIEFYEFVFLDMMYRLLFNFLVSDYGLFFKVRCFFGDKIINCAIELVRRFKCVK